MIVDDDLLSREVLSLLSADAGFDVEAFESGEQALESLTRSHAVKPDAILVDMQMPGLCGDSLACLLRADCGPATKLVGMSGTSVPSTQTQAFDAFLLKPFSIEDLCAALDRTCRDTALHAMQGWAVLDEAVYESFTHAMSHAQVRRLYAMCLEDADGRITSMRKAWATGDLALCRSHAHAIKGGCGMVGALELAQLAGRLEQHNSELSDDADQYLEMLAASSARLRSMLDAQEASLSADR